MFFLKKIISSFLTPLTLFTTLIVAGIILLWFTKRQRTGKIIITLGTILLFLFGNTPLSIQLIAQLENQYPSLNHVEDAGLSADTSGSNGFWIVVLGSGTRYGPGVPLSSQLDTQSMCRLLEGIRLYRQSSGSKLLLSGGSVFGERSVAQTMSEVAKFLGIPAEDIVVEKKSRDTADEAEIVKQMVPSPRFILVTSASHMPRSMALFRKQGMDPVAAPTDYMAVKGPFIDFSDFTPTVTGFYKSALAVHEYLGLTWSWIRGQI